MAYPLEEDVTDLSRAALTGFNATGTKLTSGKYVGSAVIKLGIAGIKSKVANASEDAEDRLTTTGHWCGRRRPSGAGDGWTYRGVHLWKLWCCPDAGGPKQTPQPHGPLHRV